MGHPTPTSTIDKRSLIDNFNSQVRATEPEHSGRYKTTRVLLVHWEGDQMLDPFEEVLKERFPKDFEFIVDSFEIPKRNPQSRLREKLVAIESAQPQQSTLLILWYIGGGSFRGRQPRWTPYVLKQSETDLANL